MPVRCTQNPTIGEEWRRGWHPERIAAAGSAASVLVVGAGPAGLECALSLGRRGYEVSVAEAADEIGGRLRFETRLPGLAAWARVLEWRRGQLERLSNVTVYRGNRLSARTSWSSATRTWSSPPARAGRACCTPRSRSRWARSRVPGVFTPDDIAARRAARRRRVVVYDFDNYYMGSVLAEHLARGGQRVSYVTPAGHASAWAIMSNEQPQIHRALFAARNRTAHALARDGLRARRGHARQPVHQRRNAPRVRSLRHRRRPFRERRAVRRAHRPGRGAWRARESGRSRASAMRWRPARWCTPSTAATAMRANWTPTPRPSPTGAMRRWPAA